MTGSSQTPPLYQVVARQAGHEAVRVPLAGYPFFVGRAPECGLRLDAPGVWPRHLRLDLIAGEGLHGVVETGALATLGDEPITERRFRHGDLLRVGPVTLEFLVSPPARYSLRGWETAVWVVLGLVALWQLGVLLGLPRD